MSEVSASETIGSEQRQQEESIGRVMEQVLPDKFADSKESKMSMLSVGCQFGYEANPFIDLYPDGEYIGVDIDERMINGARRMHSESSQAKFLPCDARKIEDLERFKPNIILLRHPQTLDSFVGNGSREDWKKIIQNCADLISPNGIILATTHLPQEADLIKDYLKEKGIDVSVTDNPNPVIPAIDSVIIVGKKT